MYEGTAPVRNRLEALCLKVRFAMVLQVSPTVRASVKCETKWTDWLSVLVFATMRASGPPVGEPWWECLQACSE
eukprot:857028-Prorocentrum_lima.AAC.1